MAQSQKQIREVFVVDALAGETTLRTFNASASDGELGIFMADGSNGNEVGKFLLAVKIGGKTVTSDVYESVQSLKAKAGEAAQEKVVSVKPTNTSADTEYVLDIVIDSFGSLSIENTYNKHAQYVVGQNGDAATVNAIVDGLIASLNKNFSKEFGASATSNPFFAFSKGHTAGDLTVSTAPDTNGDATVTVNGKSITVPLLAADTAANAATKIAAAIDAEAEFSASAAAAVVTITSASDANAIYSVSFDGASTNAVASYAGDATKATLIIQSKQQDFELGRKEGRPVQFSVRVDSLAGSSIATVNSVQEGKPGVGTGRSIALAEYFFRGYRGDGFGKQHFPYNYGDATKTTANPSQQYSVIDLVSIYEQDEEINPVHARKNVLIAVPDGVSGSVYTAINAIINKLETVSGKTQADLSE